MGKQFCLSVFGCKEKGAKATLDTLMVKSKDMGDQHGFVATDNLPKLPKTVNKLGMVYQHDFVATDDLLNREQVKAVLKPQAVSLDSHPACSDTASSKDSGRNKRNGLAQKYQASDSFRDSLFLCPEPQRDYQHDCTDRSQLAAVLTESGGSHHDTYSWSSKSQETCLDEVSVKLNDLTSGNDDQGRGLFLQHNENLGTDSQGEYRDGADILESESNIQSCENFIKLASVDTSRDVVTSYLGTSTDHILGVPFFENGAKCQTDGRALCYERAGDAEFLDSPETAVFSFSGSSRLGLDDELLSGHISDPGGYYWKDQLSMCKSPLLCDDACVPSLDMKVSVMQNPEFDDDALKFSTSEDAIEHVSVEISDHGSSPSELIFCSADKVILKPESSSKVLTLRKCKSLWKTFLMSHRNIRREEVPHQASDVVPLCMGTERESSAPLTGDRSDICHAGQSSEHIVMITDDLTKGRVCHAKTSPYGQFSKVMERQTPLLESEQFAFPSVGGASSRVQEWISNIQQPDVPADDEEIIPQNLDLFVFDKRHFSCEICEVEGGDISSTLQQAIAATTFNTALANAAVRSLNLFSTVAHLAGIGLQEVPSLGMFNSLKILNLSANCIVRVPAGCLPRSLHSLDLSSNKISLIDGFRELARLRVLNISYNRISKIGHGLANCTLIKELYLAGNKIAEVEGIYRLLKLSILDLSFNKLTTSKALGQLAANYNSLSALNLLGNPVHMNVGEEHLRKLVMTITPNVTYLNKQPIKAVLAREAVPESVAQSALGTSLHSSKSSSSRVSRRMVVAQCALQKNKSSHCRKKVDKRHGSLYTGVDSFETAGLPKQHHHCPPHPQHAYNDVQYAKKVDNKEFSFKQDICARS